MLNRAVGMGADPGIMGLIAPMGGGGGEVDFNSLP